MKESIDKNHNSKEITKNNSIFEKKLFIPLLIVIVAGFFIRFFYLPTDIPITLDGLLYFLYAIDINNSGAISTNIPVGNIGWPLFLSIFFSFVRSENFLDYMFIQRFLSIIISTCTILLIYLICTRFFSAKYSIIGALLFAFEPRIILNSTLGITDPLYVLLGSLAFFMILSNRKNFLYYSFILSGLATVVRIEGFFIFVGLSIVFFIKFRKERKNLWKYSIAVTLFVLMILPFAILKYETFGSDGVSSKFVGAAVDISKKSDGFNELTFIKDGVFNFVKFFGWVLIPSFIIFVPFGFILAKKKSDSFLILFTLLVTFSIAPFYAFTIRAFDTRYLFMLYPIFCILSLFTIKFISDKISKKNIFLISLIIVLIVTSIVFLEIKKLDINHEKEALKITSIVTEKTKVINQYLPESGYIPIIGINNLEKFPFDISSFKKNKQMENCLSIHDCKYILPIKEDNILDFIINGQKNGLTHLIVDDKEHFQYRAIFLKDIFTNEQNYPFLIKIYDSKEDGFNYHVKIFKINYEEFNKFYKNNLNEN